MFLSGVRVWLGKVPLKQYQPVFLLNSILKTEKNQEAK